MFAMNKPVRLVEDSPWNGRSEARKQILFKKFKGSKNMVMIAWEIHLFPYRTQKLSLITPMIAALGGGPTYAMYGVLNLIIAVVLFKIMPETSGRSLDEIESYMEHIYS